MIPDRLELPDIGEPRCLAEAYDRGTMRTIRCVLRFGHEDERHWWQRTYRKPGSPDLQVSSAAWYDDGEHALTFIGAGPETAA